jgi:hypothetical protein
MTLEAAIEQNTAALKALLDHYTAAAANDAKAPATLAVVPASGTAPAADTLTYPDVQKITLELSKVRGREAAVACLKQFGATKGPELKPEQYAAYVAKARAALNGSAQA